MPHTPPKVRFIYNLSSGHNTIGNYLKAIEALYEQKGILLEERPAKFGPDSEEEMIGGLECGYVHLLIAGGDGTINYIINLIKKHDIDIPVGVLSTGTANDFSTLLNMPRNPVEGCRAILEGNERRIDLGCVNGQYFVNVFSCGLFTDVSQKTPTFFKNNFGKIAYYISGISDIPKFRKMRLSIHSDRGDFEGKALIFFVFNGRTAGNLPIAYLSEVDDGLLDVLIVKGNNPFMPIGTVMQYLANIIQHKQSYPKSMVHLRCSSLVAHSARNENTDMDGQAGPAFPLQIKCHPGALRILAPEPKK